jgi:ATP-binding cassette subfamily B protein
MFTQAQREAVEAQLQPGETVLAWVTPDLNSQFHFAEGMVVLTDRRLLCDAAEVGVLPSDDADPPNVTENLTTPTGGGRPSGIRRWRSWQLNDIASLRTRDRAGIGTLELFGPEGRLAFWRYTVGRAGEAQKLVERLDAYRRGERPEDEGWDEPAIPAEATTVGRANPRVLFRLWRFARQRMKLLVLGFVLSLAATVAGLVPPYLTMPLLDNILIPHQNEIERVRKAVSSDSVPENTKLAGPPIGTLQSLELGGAAVTRGTKSAAKVAEELVKLQAQSKSQLWIVGMYLAGLLATAILAWLLDWSKSAVMAWLSERISADLRNQTYAHLQRLSLEFFGGKRTGDLLSRLSTDSERICSFLSDNVVDFAADVLMILGTTVVLFMIDPVLALAALSPLPLIAWLVYHLRGKLTYGFQRGGRAWGAMTSVLADTIPGIRVVKAFAQEKREIERFRRSNDLVLKANDRVNTVWTFFWPIVVLLNQIGLLAVWACGAWRLFGQPISTDPFTIGALTAFLTYIGRIYIRLESMSRMFTATQRAAASAQRIFDILDREPSVPEPRYPVHPGRLQGEVEFRGVDFRYGNRAIVQDLNFKIKPGEMIGLVGPSGAGKSTLVNLVCRFYDVGEGAVLADGVDIRSFPVEEYRRNIGIVLQDPFLFYGTVAENIAYGRPDATRDEVMEAARAARAHDFILRLPLGYDSLVGERGQSLSGGERQRISIARALLIDPRILILDEATSSVDTETEREIQQALDNLIEGRTTIAIAHRLSTLRRANRLIVLERGRIAEVGQHDDLIKTDGVYARLHRAQMELTHGPLD